MVPRNSKAFTLSPMMSKANRLLKGWMCYPASYTSMRVEVSLFVVSIYIYTLYLVYYMYPCIRTL